MSGRRANKDIVGARQIDDITRTDTVRLLDRITDHRGAPMADHVLAYWLTLTESMSHQHGQVGVREHVVRDAAQDHFAQRPMRIGAHHEEVGAETVGSFQQPPPKRARVDHQNMQARGDPMFQNDCWKVQVARRIRHSDQHVHLLRTLQPT